MTFIVAGMGSLDLIGKGLSSAALNTAADAAANTYAYRVNRARMAALAHLGYSAADQYAAMRPGIFLVSVAGCIASSVALARRRKACPEAPALYTLTAVVTGVAAWFTRPDWLLARREAQVNVDPNAPGVVKQAIGAVDNRVSKLSATQPGWEGRTLARLWGDLGSGTMPPVVTTLLTKHSQ